MAEGGEMVGMVGMVVVKVLVRIAMKATVAGMAVHRVDRWCRV